MALSARPGVTQCRTYSKPDNHVTALSDPKEKSNRNNLRHYWPVMTMKASVHQRRHAPCEENETADVREPGALGAKLLGENEDR